jgi:hypothetical protein
MHRPIPSTLTPSEKPGPLYQALSSFFSPPVPCLFGASDLVNDNEVPIPYLHVPSPHELSNHLLMLLPTSLQTVMKRFLVSAFSSVVLLSRVIVMMRFVFHVLCFLVPPPLPVPLFALALPHRLVAMADALFGMVTVDLIVLRLPYLKPSAAGLELY